jgi:nitroreductase
MTETIPDAAVLKNALLLACHAPSVYNSQPWRWMAQGGILDLFVDPRRIAPRSDPSGREAIISCGCVLDHLHIAMAAAGWDAHVDRFPKPNNLDHLATIDSAPRDPLPAPNATAPTRFFNAEQIGVRSPHPRIGTGSNHCCAPRSTTAPRCST